MDGLLLIDKPAGISSFGVVSKVRWIITQDVRSLHLKRGYCHQQNEPQKSCKCRVKVGHTGTLDPAATGLLVIAIGKYTKRVPELIKQDKTYEVTMSLGQVSTTGDKEGDLSEISTKQPSEQEITKVLQQFTGKIMQTPPAYSAIKINGQRAYNLARKGQEVVIEPRPVTIYKNELINYSYPLVSFDSEVGSGTYIRSLVQDIGENLGTGAYMCNLRRTKIGTFSISSAITLDDLNKENIQQNILHLK